MPTTDQTPTRSRAQRVEARTAAMRAMTPQARDRHAKLAADFAERAAACIGQVAMTA